MGSSSNQLGIEPGHWEHGVLATGPPSKFPDNLFFFYVIFNWIIIYSVVLVSAIYQHESTMDIHMSSFSWTSLTLLGGHSAQGWASRIMQQVPTRYLILHLAIYICFSATVSCPSLSFPCCVTSLISMSASLLLPCKLVHLYHFSRLHIYVCLPHSEWAPG